MTSELNHQNKILERFTATADVFAESVRTLRVEEGDRLVELATAGLALDSESLAIDVACGPGIVVCGFAPHVRHATGIDFTPAMNRAAKMRGGNAQGQGQRPKDGLLQWGRRCHSSPWF